MPNWKKVIVSGSDAVLNTVTASAGFFGTASWAANVTSASFAGTASFVNTLNQDVLISGSLTVGVTTAGASENTLTLGPKGTNEGGQLGFQAGTSATSASMLDMYQDGANPYFRLLRGSNATSDAVVAQWNTHTKQMFLPAYVSSTSFTGTPAAYLAVDTNGAIITTSGSGGSGLSGGSTNYIARWASSILLTTGSLWDNGTNVGVGNQSPSYTLDVSGDIRSTGAVYANANGTMYFRGGDDAELWDINVANTVGVYGQQDQGVASIKLGSGGGTISGRSGSIGVGTTTPNSGALHVSGGVFATSFTGSLLGTSSWATNALTASFLPIATYNITSSWAQSASQALTASYIITAQTASYVLQAVSASFASTASSVNTLRQNVVLSGSLTISGSIIGSGSAYNTDISLLTTTIAVNNTSSISYGPRYLLDNIGVRSLFWHNRVLTDPSQSVSVDWGSRTLVSGSTNVLDWSSGTGSLIGTSSWATRAISASFLPVGTYAITSSWAVSASQAITAANATNVSITGDSSGTAFTLPLILGTTGTGQTLYVDSTPAVLYTPSTNQLWASNLQATGSLFGTASWANNATTANTASYVLNAISSSFATSASFAVSASWAPSVASNPFPFTGSAIISGSLTITGSLIVKSGSSERINTSTLTIRDQNASESISWGNAVRILHDNNAASSVQWGDRLLANSSGTAYTVDWQNTVLNDTTNVISIDWTNRTLTEPSGVYTAFEYSNVDATISQLYHRAVIPAQVQRSISDSPSYAGQLIQATIQVGVTDYQLVFLDTDGTWKGTKATVANGATKMLGIAVDTAGGYVLIEGDVGVSDDNSQGGYVAGADHGLPVYVSGNTGEMTTTAPSGTGEIVRIVGHIYYQSSNDVNWWTMKFRPSSDWVEI